MVIALDETHGLSYILRIKETDGEAWRRWIRRDMN
jgi:hypothetical protein